MSSIQRLLNTLQYYTGTKTGVLITEVSAIQRFKWRGSTVLAFGISVTVQIHCLHDSLANDIHGFSYKIEWAAAWVLNHRGEMNRGQFPHLNDRKRTCTDTNI